MSNDLPRQIGSPMEVTVRTAHGAADVTVTARDAGVSLRDVLAATTGQAAPGAARVDGELVDTRTPLTAVGLVNGSVIDTHLDRDNPQHAGTALLQATGPGAGVVRPLPPGQYRIGPSARRSSSELAFETVETTAFEIDIHPGGVTVSPGSPAGGLQLDGKPVTTASSWTGGQLVVNGRSFLLEPAIDGDPGRRRERNDTGLAHVVHNRPPGAPPARTRYLIDAVRDARAQRHGLWHHRGTSESMPTSVGIADGGGASPTGGASDVSIDLVRDGVIAITGSLDDTEATTRGLLLEATTRYGPADLGVAVATDRNRLEPWDWAKWLPHARRDGVPELLANDLEIASWAAEIGTDVSRRTIVVVTDVDLWNRAGAPLHQMLADRPDHVTVIALCADRSSAPTASSVLIELDAEMPGRAQLVRLARDAQLDLRLGLVDVDTAAEVAQHLSPLVDPDLPVAFAADSASTPLTLAQITGADDAAQRWDTQLGAPGNEVELGVGAHRGQVVGIDLGIDRGLVVSGSSIDEADAVVEVVALSMGATWSPSELSIVEVDHRTAARHDAARQLPHYAGTFADRGPEAAARFVARLRQAVHDDHLAGQRLAIFVRGLAETELASPDLVSTLVELRNETVGVHLIVTTATPLAGIDQLVREACGIEIAVDRYGGLRRATMHDRDRQQRTPFTVNTPPPADERLTIEPFLFGRPLTSLERRLTRAADAALEQSDRTPKRTADGLGQLAEQRRVAAQIPLVPLPLPRTLDADRFLTRHRGDGVPVGLVETAASTAPTPHWWQPGQGGSIIAVGAPRSGVRGILDIMACGVLDRFAPDDLTISVVEHQAGRRTALASMAHTVDTVSPEQPGDVLEMLGRLQTELQDRQNDPAFRLGNRPARLLMIRDLGRLPTDAGAIVADIAEHGAVVGINVIATAAQPSELGRLLHSSVVIFVGALSDPADYAAFGVAHPERFDSVPGRCHTTIDGADAMIQLASFDTSLDVALHARIES